MIKSTFVSLLLQTEWLDRILSNSTVTTALMAIAVVLGLVVVLTLVRRLFKRIRKQLRTWEGTRIKGFSVKKYEVMSAKHAVDAIDWVVKVIRILIQLGIVALWLPLLFSVFPWSRDITHTLLGLILNPLKQLGLSFLAYLPSLFFIIVTFFLTSRLVRVLRFFSKEVANNRLRLSGFHREWATPTFNLLRVLIYLFALVIVFPYLPGSDSPAFQGISIFLGVLLSLGSTSVVGNAVGGFMLIYMRPFVVGDVVQIAGTTGKVVEKNLLVTRLSTPKNVDITIPNLAVSSNQILNYSSKEVSKGIFLTTTITLGYDVPWRQVHEVLLESAKGIESIKEKPAPFVLQTALNDFNVAYELNVYTNQPERMARILSDLNASVQDHCNAAGIEILSPHFHAVRDGNESTIPEPDRPTNATQNGFRIFPFGGWGKGNS
ncbi:MAG: mechanosensitive ion channel family protein [Salibacteraceae bacterium]